MNSHYLYLALNLASAAFPLLRSFESRVRYRAWWPALGVGLLANALFFIPMDIAFTHLGIWGFNDAFILGPRPLGLPIEEWLFFLCIPFACVFIYACLVKLVQVRDSLPWKMLAWGLAFGGLLMALFNIDRTYTLVKVGACSLFLIYHLLSTKGRGIGNLMAAYLISEIPFLLVNGVLTSAPVVWYNNAENMGIRLSDLTGIAFLNIPVEDNWYSLLMLLITVHVMERIQARKTVINPKQNHVEGVLEEKYSHA